MQSLCFPVYRDEIKVAEKKLGIALPPRYKELLLDKRVYDALISKDCKCIDKSVSMLDFAKLTDKVKELDRDFPRDAVVMFAPLKHIERKSEWGFLRFWLPDKNNPNILAETIYSWDSDKKKKYKDCSNDEWVTWPIEEYYGKDSYIFSELGIKQLDDKKLVVEVKELGSDLLVRGNQSRTTDTDSVKWNNIGIYNLKGKYITPCDYGNVPESQATPSVKTAPGQYFVYVRVKSDKKHPSYISQIRLINSPSNMNLKVKHEFSLDVDVGSVCIFDRQSLSKQVPMNLREELGMELMEIEPPIYWVKLGKTSEAIVCRAGKGDGTYSVSSLISQGTVVGMEINFE